MIQTQKVKACSNWKRKIREEEKKIACPLGRERIGHGWARFFGRHARAGTAF